MAHAIYLRTHLFGGWHTHALNLREGAIVVAACEVVALVVAHVVIPHGLQAGLSIRIQVNSSVRERSCQSLRVRAGKWRVVVDTCAGDLPAAILQCLRTRVHGCVRARVLAHGRLVSACVRAVRAVRVVRACVRAWRGAACMTTGAFGEKDRRLPMRASSCVAIVILEILALFNAPIMKEIAGRQGSRGASDDWT
eukprot:6191324-Pleurochrysis_carterae.AAC.4